MNGDLLIRRAAPISTIAAWRLFGLRGLCVAVIGGLVWGAYALARPTLLHLVAQARLGFPAPNAALYEVARRKFHEHAAQMGEPAPLDVRYVRVSELLAPAGVLAIAEVLAPLPNDDGEVYFQRRMLLLDGSLRVRAAYRARGVGVAESLLRSVFFTADEAWVLFWVAPTRRLGSNVAYRVMGVRFRGSGGNVLFTLDLPTVMPIHCAWVAAPGAPPTGVRIAVLNGRTVEDLLVTFTHGPDAVRCTFTESTPIDARLHEPPDPPLRVRYDEFLDDVLIRRWGGVFP